MIEDLLAYSADELTVYLVGSILLVVIPPLVGLVSSWILFGTPAEDLSTFLRRLILVASICLGVTFGLGYAGVSLLIPASPQAVWMVLGIAFIFGMLGAGRLNWNDESEGNNNS
ncbi:MAG: hypothetical protein QNJ45_15130 [Ardenticatenaceae bacterium]|nr:hypothetical protein [Ardenticatenaceae bacterium]